jgi:hypothetical protein
MNSSKLNNGEIMTYCEFNDYSDMNLIKTVFGDLELWFEGEIERFETAKEALTFVLLLKDEGKFIPIHVIEWLNEEIGKVDRCGDFGVNH